MMGSEGRGRASGWQVRLGSLVQRFPAQRLAAGRLQSQALISFAILGAGAVVSGLGAVLGGGGGGDGIVAGAAASAAAGAAMRFVRQLSGAQCVLLLISALLPGAAATLLQAQGQKVRRAPY